MSTNKAVASKATNRPLSPFMIGPFYKPQLTSMLSITHRLTGLVVTLGSLFIAGWLISLAAGPYWYEGYAHHMLAWYGQVLLFLWSWCTLFHLCNGVRHLGWDVGFGLDLKTAYLTGYSVVIVSAVLTIAVWILAYAA
ncbi:MAG: sdhC [Hydrocarboniphaga sp.]|uniref:succinate dehydrogenase, cytochrome b556 subunit n=1 Tax=Hydrocarboniphaga sp. TaxID=2033016 RepID=UPI00261C64DE|nr:succinate dehydrogenase, cytochrome b556 subunit [Hydrocarboniphaga sp.]MDB5967943.1 sdhC [Hydrocarboniphaga sp.]